jgi:flavin-dependent dehydrogenase
MCRGRVAFIGDAAFVARPHVGQGVTKAAGDALCLARSLRDASVADVPALLHQFSEARLAVGHMAVEHARQMGAPVVISPMLSEGPHWENYYSQAENLIRDTAVELDGVVTKEEAALTWRYLHRLRGDYRKGGGGNHKVSLNSPALCGRDGLGARTRE